MMRRIQQYHTLLLGLQAADPKTRLGILRYAPDDFIKALLEVVLNFLHGNIPHKPATMQNLKRYRRQLRKLNKIRSMKKARKEMMDQKGGFLPFLLAPLLALIGGK